MAALKRCLLTSCQDVTWLRCLQNEDSVFNDAILLEYLQRLCAGIVQDGTSDSPRPVPFASVPFIREAHGSNLMFVY